ncbi:DUF4174 domain-containing protein [Agrobacterium bohemicum]|uniref:DUF4174 domain-containing protein n=1 Tax=Agrobacterium bohemicum TaxID=2052828 RepID=A0A135P965_9HYPH|nr:DUF4174 domain-containing protein [Agrobacterium bohemicum]KXG87979.1 hypothetical protein ATO67_16395 [Agrobacterium bohemicum]
MRVLILSLVVALTSISQGFAMESLSHYEWKNRVVLVFGKATDRKVERQIDALKAKQAELADRALIVIRITGNEARAVYGTEIALNADKLRTDAKIDDNDFQVILVGKDGGVKFRSKDIVSDVEIFDLIDRMPMRKAGQG